MDTENRYGTLAIQKGLLLLLKEFDSFCTQKGIQYSLSGGSLLGAVRHKGFIPWDDDLDCVMDRSNYNRLSAVISCSESLYVERLTATSLWTDRIRLKERNNNGIYCPTLDVFIYDHCPDNKLLSGVKLFFIRMLQGMIKYHLNLEKGSFIMKAASTVTFLIGHLFSHETKMKWYNRVSQWGNKKDSKMVKLYNDQFFALKTSYPVDVMDVGNCIRMPFEDTEVNGFAEYDRYLRHIYGNYMVPPSVSNRVPQHMKR